jgi:hypothetical protein
VTPTGCAYLFSENYMKIWKLRFSIQTKCGIMKYHNIPGICRDTYGGNCNGKLERTAYTIYAGQIRRK